MENSQQSFQILPGKCIHPGHDHSSWIQTVKKEFLWWLRKRNQSAKWQRGQNTRLSERNKETCSLSCCRDSVGHTPGLCRYQHLEGGQMLSIPLACQYALTPAALYSWLTALRDVPPSLCPFFTAQLRLPLLCVASTNSPVGSAPYPLLILYQLFCHLLARSFLVTLEWSTG